MEYTIYVPKQTQDGKIGKTVFINGVEYPVIKEYREDTFIDGDHFYSEHWIQVGNKT